MLVSGWRTSLLQFTRIQICKLVLFHVYMLQGSEVISGGITQPHKPGLGHTNLTLADPVSKMWKSKHPNDCGSCDCIGRENSANVCPNFKTDNKFLGNPVYWSVHPMTWAAERFCVHVFEYFLLHPKHCMWHEQCVAEFTQNYHVTRGHPHLVADFISWAYIEMLATGPTRGTAAWDWWNQQQQPRDVLQG